jgi:predicted lipid-binding transport protein (Tim44 family)
VTFVDLDADASPATVTVHLELEGVRYVEDRNTLTLVAGSKDDPTRFDGTWTLALDGSPDVPWRISAVRDDRPREPLRAS